jgi:general stress protein YciG
MEKQQRGFASMDREKHREIARKGGRAAHVQGTAHEWTVDEAREAGRKGGIAYQRNRQAAETTNALDPFTVILETGAVTSK